MPRAASLPRAITLIGALAVLIGGLTVGPAAARTSPPSDERDTPPTVERARAREVGTRGRVDVERIGRHVDAVSLEPLEPAGDPGAPALTDDGPDITAETTGQATTNDTPPPVLGSTGRLERDASTPSPMIAVGPDHQVRSDELLAHMSERTGGGAVVVAYADLFLLPDGTTNSSARIWFEPARQRWIAVQASRDCVASGGATFGHGFLDIAVSDGADPTAGWSVYFFASDDSVVSRPSLGTSSDKLIVTSRLQPMGAGCAPTSEEIWDLTSLDWADMLTGGEDDAAYFVFDADSAGSIEWLMPAVQQPATSATAFVVAQHHDAGTDADHTQVMEITGTGAGTIIADTDDLTDLDVIPALGPPMAVPQGTGSFMPASVPTSAVWRGGRLVVAHTETCTPTGDTVARSCARIVDLTTSGSGTGRRQDFHLASDERHTYNPGVAFSRDGQLIIAYDRSTLGGGPAGYVVRQRPTDTAGTVSAAVNLFAATGIYRQPNGPDIVGLAPDPQVPDSVWVANVIGTASAADADPDYDVRTSQARTSSGSTFKTINPLRVLDTRNGTGLSGAFLSGSPRTFQVAGVGTIPAAAVAITANVTVTGQTGSGFVSITPTATINPVSSTLNFPLGDTRANNVTVSLDTAGKLAAIYRSSANKTAHIVVDVTGYFLADPTGATYKPLTPVRLLDTRVNNGLTGAFAANTPRSVQITGRGGIPASGVVAITANLTVTGQTRAGYVSVTPNPTASPTTSTINFPTGDTRANGLTIPLSTSGKVAAVYKASSGTTHLVLDVTGYYVTGSSGLRFYPLEPGRILDTRATTMTLLTGKFTSSSARTLVTGGHFGVPATALAVTGNLTVTGQSKGGYVSVTKSKTNTPSVSTINFPVGDTRANGITVPLDANNDQHLVYKASSGATTHVIMDLTGYFR
jgi:hypothetical protein